MVFPLVCYLWSVFRDETQLTEYTEVCSMNKIKMNSFFSLFFFFFVLILSYFCVPVPWGSQKRKLLQAAAEVWKGVKNLSSWPLHPLSTSPCPPILLSQSVLLFRSPHLKGCCFMSEQICWTRQKHNQPQLLFHHWCFPFKFSFILKPGYLQVLKKALDGMTKFNLQKSVICSLACCRQ